MKIFLTSDQHFGHTNVIRLCNRPFTSIDHMNESLIENFNMTVGTDDETWHLGDFSMSFQNVEKHLRRMNGKHHLIMGNHDSCHPAHKKGKKQPLVWAEKYFQAGFTSLSLHDHIQLPGGDFAHLCHMPFRSMEPGEHGQKYSEFRPVNDGRFLIHGHVHNCWKQRGRMLNVGVDMWDFKPVALTTILELIAQGEANVPSLY